MLLSNNDFVFDFARAFKKWLLILLVFFCFNSIGAQQSTQELKEDIRTMEHHQNFSAKDTVYIKRLIELAFNLRYRNWDSVLLLSKKTLKLSKSAGFDSGEGSSYATLGLYYSGKGDSKNAFKNFNKAITVFKRIKNYRMQVVVSNMLAMEHLYNHQPSKALLLFMDSLEISKEEKMNEVLLMTLENLGLLYVGYLKDYDHGIYFLNESKKAMTKMKDFLDYNMVLSNLAHCYFQKGDVDKAMLYLEPSTAYFKKEGYVDWLLLNNMIKAGILIKKKKFEEALIWLDEIEKLHKDVEDDKSLVEFYHYKFEVYINLKNLTAAERYAHKSYELAKKMHFVSGIEVGLKDLYAIHKAKSDFDTALEYHEQFITLTDTLLRSINESNFNVLLAKVEYDEQKRKIIQENEIARAKQNRYIIIAVMVLCIIFCIVFLIWKNTKTQEKFNTQLRQEKEKLEKNELFLKEANRTKDKLFSIIGHDLRSPIGAFKGLLTLFKDKEIDEDEFISFIPKLEADLGGISFMLNNLLSWGRSQMNGDTTTPEVVEAKNLVTENINLLSEVARNKAIAMVNEVPSDACIWADGNQIDIVFRNLMSNALKFTDDHGVITIGGEEMEAVWRFYVRDTGIGMDTEAQEKIFIKNSTHTTYGTHNEKGTGLGLNLCKEMVQKNKGTIWVESALQIGSCFYFEIPKAMQVFKNVG